MAVARRQIRSRPIRLLLIGTFAVPLISLVALWGFAADITLSSAIGDHNYNSANRAISPAVQPLLLQLATEREETYAWQISGGRASKAALDATRQHTDEAVAGAKRGYQSVRTLLSAQGQAGLSGLFAALDRFGAIRQGVDSGAMTPVAAFQAYSGIADYILHYMKGAPRADVGAIYQATIGAMDGDYALEMAGREAALAGGVLETQHPMSGTVRQLFASTMASRRLLMSDALAMMNPTLRAVYSGALGKDQQLMALEDQIAATPGTRGEPLAVSPAAWPPAISGYLTAMQKAEDQNIVLLSAMSSQLSDRLVTEAALAGGAGLAAVIVSAALLFWLGRKVTGELTGLLGSVRSMAEERLPRIVERLRRGDDVNVAAESPPPRTGTITEISRVAEAFSIVQGAAVQAAVDQAKLRKGISQVFLNLSMRNQSLLHRQLSMLDTMERRTNDADVLGDLFRLDHLTTRMRRHAEGLIILAGVTPGRGWRGPVPVVDVLRAAVAEVEDYVRVDVVSESGDSVAGSAVNDVIHLIAELVENATAFSPPETRIEVRADRVGSGLVAEIEDRGLGLSDAELADINGRLARPPEFDFADSNQLGLFIVGRLAARHGISVALRRSPYGGVTAIVLLPRGMVVWEEEAMGTAAMPGQARAGWPGLPGQPNAAPPPAALLPSPAPSPAPAGNADNWAFRPTERYRTPAAADPDQQRTDMHHPSETDRNRPASVPPWEIPDPELARRQAAGPAADGMSENPSPGRAPRPTTAGGSHLGMPVRVPQASIAAQLRAQAPRGEDPMPRGTAAPTERSPEATRSMLLSMQEGWQRGRLADLDSPGSAFGREN